MVFASPSLPLMQCLTLKRQVVVDGLKGKGHFLGVKELLALKNFVKENNSYYFRLNIHVT